MTPSQKRLAVRFYVGFTVLCALALVALVGAEAYIRWALNQNFTLLGTPSLLGICMLVLGQTWGLVYLATRKE